MGPIHGSVGKMKYGINVPNFGDYFQSMALSELARDAEDSGWDGSPKV